MAAMNCSTVVIAAPPPTDRYNAVAPTTMSIKQSPADEATPGTDDNEFFGYPSSRKEAIVMSEVPVRATVTKPADSRRRSALDGDQGADRRVGPDLGRRRQREFDAADALRRAERGAVEGVQGVAAVEVADPLDARVAVVRAVRVGAAHRGLGEVLEHRERAQLGRGGGHAGVAG